MNSRPTTHAQERPASPRWNALSAAVHVNVCQIFLGALFTALVVCNPATATGLPPASIEQAIKSKTVEQGLVEIASTIRAPGAAVRTNAVQNFVVILSNTVDSPATEIHLAYEAYLLPPEAEFWSRGKQLSAGSSSRRSVEQIFPVSGESFGFSVRGESELAPLVSPFHVGSLLSVLDGQVKRIQRQVRIRSAVQSESPNATLTIEVVHMSAEHMTLAATMDAPEQSWAEGDQIVTFGTHRTELIVVDRNTGLMLRREGKQETTIQSDKGFERTEVVSFVLRGANTQ